jgi:tape measure domain-containing protein
MTTERIDIVVSQRGAETVSRKITQVGASAESAARSLDLMKRVMIGVFGIEGIRRVIGLADAYTNFKNRVSVVTSSQDELKVVMGKVYDIAERSRSGLQETADLYTRIALSSKSLGISQSEALQMTESVNKAIILSGASTQEASAGMIQFGQALASGRLRGDELRSIMEQLPMVADIIARHLGVTRGELWALGHQGKITSLDLVEAFRGAREEIEERFGKFVPTLSQGFIVMRSAIIMTMGKFNEFGSIAQGFFKIATFVSHHTDEIARAALGATMAFGIFAGARGIGAVINALRALAVLLYTNPITIIGTAAIIAAGQLVAFSDQILVSAGSLITLQDFGVAAFQYMMDGIRAFIQYFNDNFGFIGDYAKEIFGEFDFSILGSLQFAAKVVDSLIGLFVGAYRAIVKAFDNLPAALELIFVSAFNSISAAVAKGINFLIDGINRVTDLADIDPIQHIVPNVIEASNEAKQHGNQIGKAFVEGFMEPSFATDALTDIMERASVISAERIKREAEEAERLKKAEGLLGESGPPNIPNPGGKDGKGRGVSEPESFEDIIKGIQVENELLGLNRKEREIRQSLMDAESRMERSMTTAEEALTRALLEQNQALQVQSDTLESIKGPEEDLIDRRVALIALFEQGAISVKEFQEAVRDLNVELTALENTYSGGLENGLARMIQQSNELGAQVSDLVVDSFDRATESIVNFAKTGELNVREFFASLFEQLLRLTTNQLFSQLLSGMGGGGGFGGLGSLFGGLGGLLGFKEGGSFKVGGSGGPDSQLVAFKATPGEQVDVKTPQQQSGGGDRGASQAAPVNIRVVNVVSPSETIAAMSSVQGEKAILNAIERNPAAVERLLRR